MGKESRFGRTADSSFRQCIVHSITLSCWHSSRSVVLVSWLGGIQWFRASEAGKNRQKPFCSARSAQRSRTQMWPSQQTHLVLVPPALTFSFRLPVPAVTQFPAAGRKVCQFVGNRRRRRCLAFPARLPAHCITFYGVAQLGLGLSTTAVTSDYKVRSSHSVPLLLDGSSVRCGHSGFCTEHLSHRAFDKDFTGSRYLSIILAWAAGQL